VDLDETRALAERYLGSLPSSGGAIAGKTTACGRRVAW
jgi:hypothetical protein